MTYGWALVLIATAIGVLVILVGTPAESPVFNSSEPTKLPIRGGTIDTATPQKASVILKNATGGKIKVTKITLGTGSSFTGCSGSCKLNDIVFIPGNTIAIEVIAGLDLKFENIIYSGTGSGTITVDYIDIYNFSRTLTITGRKGKG